jgi:chromosomal replication initiator protein
LDNQIKGVKYEVGRCALRVTKKSPSTLLGIDQLEFPELKVDRETNLNPKYTFENFVVGPFNELPHAASWAVAKNPGVVYNPLFIYGGVGLGKTHLLQAIGNEIVKGFPEKKVKYIPCEKFTSGIISAIRNGNIENFKSKYQKIDVLVIDDVQFLAGKEKTQEEFFHIFNALYEKNKQIVLSSDRSPKAIPALTERLRSRFEGGMIADIGYPDFETRVAILKAKAKERQVEFEEEIYSYIAQKIQKNIRELEGALNKLIAFQKLKGNPPTLENTKALLKKIIVTPPRITTPKKIIQAVAEFYDLKKNELTGRCRRKEIVKPRQIAAFLLRENLRCSYPFIAKQLGKRDHTTAIHSYKRIKKLLEEDENLQEEINLIKQRILGS